MSMIGITLHAPSVALKYYVNMTLFALEAFGEKDPTQYSWNLGWETRQNPVKSVQRTTRMLTRWIFLHYATGEAASRFATNGPNVLSPPKQESEFVKYMRHVLNPLLLLLDAAAVLCVITYAVDVNQRVNLWLGIILFAVVIFTATMGYLNVRSRLLLLRDNFYFDRVVAGFIPCPGASHECDHGGVQENGPSGCGCDARWS
jgi:hypothetical protein